MFLVQDPDLLISSKISTFSVKKIQEKVFYLSMSPSAMFIFFKFINFSVSSKNRLQNHHFKIVYRLRSAGKYKLNTEWLILIFLSYEEIHGLKAQRKYVRRELDQSKIDINIVVSQVLSILFHCLKTSSKRLSWFFLSMCPSVLR